MHITTIQLEDVLTHPEYISIHQMPGIHLDLRYAGEDNFIGHNLYGDFDGGLLHSQAASQLARAAHRLQAERPGWRLRVLDALRPGRVQRLLWDRVKGTPQHIYVADPARGSIHSFGMAVDVTLEDECGQEQDLGTRFDDFTLLAQPAQERQMLQAGLLDHQQLELRQLLRDCMQQAGFHGIASEWWHFEAADSGWIRANMLLVE